MTGRGVLERWGRALLLLRSDRPRLDAAVTALTASLLVWFRFGYLANGPWEWDEPAFARAVLDFDLAAYFPHPPGYPGWIAIGHLLTPLAGDPLVALQWASAALSVVALWPLAALGRRVAPPVVALTAALLVLLAPGPSLHAVRAFSTTAAAVLALAGAAVAAGGMAGARPTIVTVLMACAFLVRPNLLPPLAVLWLGLAAGVRPWRRLWPGVMTALAMGGVALAMMARAQGGLGAVLGVFASHANRHFSRLVGNVAGYPDLGLVKGLGGVVPASLLLGAAVVGGVVWGRRVGRRSAWLWAAVLAAAVGQLLFLQNRTYARYAVGVQMAVAPLVAGAAALAPPALATPALVAAAGWMAMESRPLLVEQHRDEVGLWQALQRAAGDAAERDMAVVVESEMHLFASYLWLRAERQGVVMPPRVLSPWNPEPWRGVDRPYLVATVHRGFYPPSLVGQERRFGGVSERLYPLTQQRFLEAWVISAPPLPLAGWWPGERMASGERFMWGAARCELLLPPLPPASRVGLRIRPAPGPAPLVVEANGDRAAELEGASQPRWVWIGPDQWRADRANQVRFVRDSGYQPGTGDPRPLAVQLLDARLVGPTLPWHGSLVTEEERAAYGIRLTGHHDPELFGQSGSGLWLEPQASLELPAGPGRVTLTMWAPRPEPPATEVRLDGRTVAGPLELGGEPREVAIDIDPADVAGGMVRLDISSRPYLPAAAGHGSDPRRLGVVVSAVRYDPDAVPEWARPLAGGEGSRPRRRSAATDPVSENPGSAISGAPHP